MDDKERKPRQEPKSTLRFEDDSPVDNGVGTSGHNGPKSKKPHTQFREQSAQSEPPNEHGHIGDGNNDSEPKRAKKPHTKFCEYSEQLKPSDKLQPDDAPSVGGSDRKATRESRGMEKSKLRMEKTGAKLEKATTKRNKKKPQKNSGALRSVGSNVAAHARMYTHRKIYEAEHENSGVESAHRTELVGERVGHSASRFIKQRNRTRPARRMKKIENRAYKAKADFQWRKMTHEHPELKKNVISKYMQKRRLKKRYQKQAKDAAKKGAKAAKKAAKKTATTTAKVVAKIGRAIVANPKVLLIILIAVVLLLLLYSCMGAVSMMGNGMTGGIVTSVSYVAEDAEIDRAVLAFTEWETDLQLEINNIETARPGYDEYRYNMGTIGHNPYELMGFLTAVYNDFTYSGVESVLQEIFNQQYTFTTQELTETSETTNEDGETVTEEKKILVVTLTVRPFSEVIQPRMNAEQQERYAVLLLTKGARQNIESPFIVNWLPNVTSNYGYRVHPISGIKDLHRGADIVFPEGYNILAGFTGTVTFADNNADYGLVVVIDNGAGLVAKYAHCSELLVTQGQTVEAGHAIAKVGTTGSSTGPHVHMEVLKDGQHLNPLFYAATNDTGI